MLEATRGRPPDGSRQRDVLCEDNSLVGVGFRKVWLAQMFKSAPS